MALTERTRDYETLIRYNDDGTIGASHATIYEVLDDNGAIITARVNSPEQLAVAAADSSALTAVLGPALIAAEAEKASLNDQVAVLKQQVDGLREQLAASQQASTDDTGTAAIESAGSVG